MASEMLLLLLLLLLLLFWVFHTSVSWWFFIGVWVAVLLLYSFESFSLRRQLMVSHWNLSDSKSLQVSRTLLSILADLNNAVVWMVSTHPLISKSSCPCTNPLVTVPSALITIRITVTFMFHSFFSSQARFKYLFLFSLFFSFNLRSAGIVTWSHISGDKLIIFISYLKPYHVLH